MKERLLRAYFVEARRRRPRRAGRRSAGEVGLDATGAPSSSPPTTARPSLREELVTGGRARRHRRADLRVRGPLGRARRPGPRHDVAVLDRLRQHASADDAAPRRVLSVRARRDRPVDLVVDGDVGGAIGAHVHQAHARVLGRRAPRRAPSASSTSRGDAVGARPAPAMSTPWGVPNSCSNRRGASAAAWGRNEKMPPPSLSTTTIVRSTPRPARRAGRWCRAGRRRRRSAAPSARPRGEGHADRGRHHAVDAVGAPVGEHPHAVAGRAVPLDVAHRHRRRHHQRGAVGQGGERARGRRPARWARRGAASTPSMAAWAARLGRAASGPATACRWPPVQPLGERDAQRGRIGDDRDVRRCGRGRSTRRAARPGPARRRTPPATGRAPSTPAAGPRRSTTVGRVVGGEAGVAQQGVEGGDGGRARGRGSPTADRPAPASPVRVGEPCTATGSPAPPPATMTPRWPSSGRADGVELGVGEARRSPTAGVPWRTVRPPRRAARRARRPAARGTAGSGAPGPAAGRRSPRRRPGPPSERHDARRRLVGRPRVVEPAHRAGRTGGPGRSVWGAATSRSSGGRSAVHDEQRHLGLVGLDDGRVEVGRGGAAGAAAATAGRPLASPRPRAHERRRPLVVVHVHAAAGRRRPAPAPAASSASRARRPRR